MKIFDLFFACTLLFSSFEAMAAKNYKNLNYRPLIQRLQSKINLRKRQMKETKLLKFNLSPEVPQTTDSVSIFVQPLTGFTDSEMLLDISLDSISLSSITEHPATELWTVFLGVFTELRSHTVSVKIFLRDKNATKLITDAIAVLDTAITDLNNQISNATDPDVIVQLTAQRDDKIAQKNELLVTLASLQTQIGEESFDFSIADKGNLPGYPRIFSVAPNVMKANVASSILISGENFADTQFVKVDGAAATLSSHTDSNINAVIPGLSPGPHDLEVSAFTENQIRNIFFKNAVFATTGDLANPNTPPTAIAHAVSSPIAFGGTVQVSASGSFDANNKPLRYEWHFVSVPNQAPQAIGGSAVGTGETFSFTPTVPGFYLLELKAFQTEGLMLSSSPALAVVEVNSPANRPAQIAITPIHALINQSATAKLNGADPDFWQEHNVMITRQSSLGTATLVDGEVHFVAGAQAGTDFITMMIIDSGTPPLATQVQVPVRVWASNQPPVILPVTAQMVTQGLPVQVKFVVTGFGDDDGDETVAQIKIDTGDGVTEEVPLAGSTIYHNYVSYGSYNAVATITDVLGATATYNFTVNVVPTDLPTAKFSLDKYTCSAPCTITADASASSDLDGIAEYRWYFYDGGSEENSTVVRSHTYENPGVYRVRLRTRDINQAQGESIVKVYVGVTPPAAGTAPIADFNFSPAREVTVGTSVTLDASRSFDPNPSGNITNYNWNSGNCNNKKCLSTGISANFSYPLPTNYFPALSVTDAEGDIATAVGGGLEVISVTTGHAPRPIISLNRTPAYSVTGEAPFLVFLDSSLSYDYDGTIVDRNWYIADGTESHQTSFSKVFEVPGVYFVALKTIDNDGNYPVVNSMVTVTPPGKKVIRTKKTRSFQDDPNAEQKQYLIERCSRGNGESCFFLAKIYQEEGNTFVWSKLMEKACALSYQPACLKKR